MLEPFPSGGLRYQTDGAARKGCFLETKDPVLFTLNLEQCIFLKKKKKSEV